MANLTIERKKSSGYGLQEKITVTIDDETIITILPNEKNTITLPNGNHKINFYYFQSIKVPFFGTTELKINETHDFSIVEDTIITVTISNAKLKIQENETKIKTKSSPMNDVKLGKWSAMDLWKFAGVLWLLILPLIFGAIIGCMSLNSAAAIACIINGIFMISIPSGLYFWCKNSEIKKFYDKKYIIFSSSYTVIATVLALFLPFKVGFAIISSFVALIVLCIAIIRNTSLHYEKIIAIALILTLFLAWMFASSSPSDNNGDGCGVCDGSGYVPDDGWGWEICPYCKGSGISPQ